MQTPRGVYLSYVQEVQLLLLQQQYEAAEELAEKTEEEEKASNFQLRSGE